MTTKLLLLLGALMLVSGTLPERASAAEKGPSKQSQGGQSTRYQEASSKELQSRSGTIQNEDEAGRPDARAEGAEHYEQEQLQVQREATLAAQQQARAGWVQAIFGFLGFALLAWTLWYSRKSSLAASDAVAVASEALRHTETSADAAMRGAVAAENAIALTADHFERTMRPHIVLTPVWQPGENLTIRVSEDTFLQSSGVVLFATMQNVGQAPAHDLFLSMQICLCQPDEEPVWKDAERHGAPSVLPPAVTASTVEVAATPDQIDEVFSGRIRLFVKASADYLLSSGGNPGKTVIVIELKAHAPFAEVANHNLNALSFTNYHGSMMA